MSHTDPNFIDNIVRRLTSADDTEDDGSWISPPKRRGGGLAMVMEHRRATVIDDMGNNLSAYYRLSETSGSTAADASGLVRNATLSRKLSTGTKRMGSRSARISPGDSAVAKNVRVHGTSDMSVAFWVRMASLPTGSDKMFIVRRGDGSAGRAWITVSSAGVILYNSYFGVGKDYWSNSMAGVLADLNWHHVCVTYDRDGNQTLYVDGVADTSISMAGASADKWQNAPWTIGVTNGTAGYVSGDLHIDDFRCYSRVLSATEIDAIYDWGVGNPTRHIDSYITSRSRLVARWHMQDTEGVLGSEILLNNDFETWTTSPGAPDSWELSGAGQTVTKMNDGAGISGSNYARVVQTSTANVQGIRQILAGLVAGKEYVVTGWARVDSGNAQIKVQNNTDSISECNASTTNGHWTKLTCTFTAQAGKTYQIECIGTYPSTNGHTSYFDAISVKQRGLLDNPNFDVYTATPGLPDNWSNNGGNLTQYSKETSIVYDVPNALKIASDASATFPGVYQNATGLVAGKAYRLRARVRAGNNGDVCALKLRNTTDSVTLYESNNTTTEWVEKSIVFFAQAGKTYQVTCYVADTGLTGTKVGYFDEVILEEFVITDSSESGYHLTPARTETYAGPSINVGQSGAIGSAIEFTNDSLLYYNAAIPSRLYDLGGSGRTWCGRVYLTGGDTDKTLITTRNGTATDNGGYFIAIRGSGKLGLYFTEGGIGEWGESTGIIALNTWTHWAVAWNPTTKVAKFYINGVLSGSHTFTLTPTNQTGYFRIGGDDAPGDTGFGGNEHQFLGKMEDVRIYDVGDLNDQYFDLLYKLNPYNLDVLQTFEDVNDAFSSDISAADGNAFIATLRNQDTLWVAGKYGNAWEATGNAYLSATIDDNIMRAGHEDKSWTIAAWYKAHALWNVEGDGIVVGRAGGNGGICHQGTNIVFRLVNSSESPTGITTPVGDLEWHHYAAVYSNGSMKLYKDGVLVASGTFSGTFRAYTTALLIGGSTSNSVDFHVDGLIDNVRIYNRALSADDVVYEMFSWAQSNALNTHTTAAFSGGRALQAVVSAVDGYVEHGLADDWSAYKYLQFYAKSTVADSSGYVEIYDGSTWHNIGSFVVGTSFQRVTLDMSSIARSSLTSMRFTFGTVATYTLDELTLVEVL